MSSPSSRQGFSLLELSISLVVIGLIVGGIMGGASLIRSAQIRSVASDIDRIKTSIEQFQEKYAGLPGDITNATSLWAGTTNGDGNGYINSDWLGSGVTETFGAWQQMALAGFIPGSYTGTNAGCCPFVTSANTMTSKYRNGLYFLWNAADASNSIFGITKGNCILFSGIDSISSPMGGIMDMQDAADLDRKIDDGIANKGNVYGVDGNDSYGLHYCSLGNWDDGVGADYNYSSTATAGCRLYIWYGEKR